jgi:ABC-2 type transport system ATP-binding protein
MATLLQPSQGDARIAGHSVKQEPQAVRRAIGYMPDTFGVYPDMTVREYLDFFAACYSIPEVERTGLIGDLLELVDLTHRAGDRAGELSRGLQQRLSLARTLVHDPQVLLLDEPASGLDPRARVEIRALLVELSRLGKTIFFSTHILADVAEICTQVGIIEAGRLVAVGSLEALQLQHMPSRQVEITVLDRLDETFSILAGLPSVASIQVLDPQEGVERYDLRFEFTGEDPALSEVLSNLTSKGIPVVYFSENRRDLEEVFLRATKGLVT